MCGVIGYISETNRNDLGLIAAELLKTLEYRGYDSTGAAVQGDGTSIDLRKGVGAPSVMVDKLGISGLRGSIICGQVRWATFGSVTDDNAQPHEVRCKTHIYGAHNGNVTNCDDLKAWHTAEGHDVLSDNDGEMLVHTIEHAFAIELAANPNGIDGRRASMRRAVVTAGAQLEGSYAAVIVDPVSRTLWAIKAGSSLYFGIGRDEAGSFALASSDLSSVLKVTRVLVPMSEGEFIEYTPSYYHVYALRDGTRLERHPARSRLQAKDAALLPQFRSFMEQEIDAQEETCRRIAALFDGGSAEARRIGGVADRAPAADRVAIDAAIGRLRDEYDDERIHRRFAELIALPSWQRFSRKAAPEGSHELQSADSALLTDILGMASADDERTSVVVLDALLQREESREFEAAADAVLAAFRHANENGGRVFFVCCGSSYHASLAGAVFFNEIAHSEIVPVLPGEFRGRFAASLRPNDVVVAVSQSGETKDLIDVMNHVIATGLPIRRIAIVNNISSTLGQEKCDTVLPLRCGPEIAVPATKSYINQMAMMLGLAARMANAPGRVAALPQLIRDTLVSTEAAVEEAAQLLYLRPSIHILATRLLAIAKEGALKVREVVLNHTEGYEASEFKHGPNTILGVNTVYGIDAVLRYASSGRLDDLYDDYPLIFTTGPDPTDVNLTVSQVNTHKIRGATCVMIAEENAALRQAIEKAPADNPRYRSVYVTLPQTGDNLLTLFTAIVALQRLALRMSMLKQEHLDRLGLRDHGVHPDVPKNVSKSITVD